MRLLGVIVTTIIESVAVEMEETRDARLISEILQDKYFQKQFESNGAITRTECIVVCTNIPDKQPSDDVPF